MERPTTPLRAPAPRVPGIAAAQVVLPCADVAATLAFFTEELGFRVELISPADDPSTVVISGLGVRLRLERTDAGAASGAGGAAPALVLTCDDPPTDHEIVAPNGSVIRFVPAHPPLEVPPLVESLVISRLADAAGFHAGRAGMGYRDLIPDRLGGRFIASHIRIDEPGPVPDYVHFHEIRFQMIFCARGWTRLVYEDQGEPFLLEAGDCVLQPPTIRHRVLEASAGLEVVEIGCPAIHDTYADPAMSLPTGRDLPERAYGDERTGVQRFVRHVGRGAAWRPHRFPGFEHRDTGIERATDGLAGARVLRPLAGAGASAAAAPATHAGELWFGFVLGGTVELELQRAPEGPRTTALVRGDAVTIPSGAPFRFVRPSADVELLEVTLPA